MPSVTVSLCLQYKGSEETDCTVEKLVSKADFLLLQRIGLSCSK